MTMMSVLVTAAAGGRSSSHHRDDGLLLMIVLSTCVGAVLLLVAAILLTVCMYHRRLHSQRINQHQGKQDRWPIAKVTARCDLYMGPLTIFESPMSTPTATFAEIFNGLLFRSIRWMCVQNLKFVVSPVPEIIRGTWNMISPWIRPRCLFSKIFNGLLFGWTFSMYEPNLQSVALLFPEIIAIAVLGWGCEPPMLGKRRS